MKRWQYKCVRINLDYTEASELALNDLGSEGWELVAVSRTRVCVFKREVAG